jgi:nucleoside-diphosphate-sugar epimerase
VSAQKKTAFVTGGTGFVGSHLVEELQRRGYDEVRCMVRSDPKWLADFDVTFVRGDLSEETDLESALQGVTHIYHVAGLTRSKDDAEFVRANVDGTLHLLRAAERACPDVDRVLVTSTLAVVGTCGVQIATEDTPMNPVSGYGRSKAMMERRMAEQDEEGRSFYDRLSLTVIRPPAVYGPREQDILTFFKTVNRGLCPIIGGDGADLISLVHVDDLVRGMVDAAESGATIGETYFLGSPDAYTWEQVRDVTVEVLGRRVLTVRVPPKLVNIVGAVTQKVAAVFGQYPPLNEEKAREILEACKACSSEKAASHFGYTPSISLEEGIRSTIRWYREIGWIS